MFAVSWRFANKVVGEIESGQLVNPKMKVQGRTHSAGAAENVADMSATCRRHVANKAKCCLFLPRWANFGDMKFCVSAHNCVVMF